MSANDSNERWVTFAAVAVIACVAMIFIGIGLIVARQITNDERCEIALGYGSSFAGNGKCYPPRVPVDGLLSIVGRG